MPSDAKFGLAVGVTLVIAVAVLFYRKESTTAAPAPAQNSTAVPLPAVPPAPVARPSFPANGRAPVAQTLIYRHVPEGDR